MSGDESAPSIMSTLTTAVMKDVPSTAAAVASTASSSSSAAGAGSEPSVNQKLFLVVSVALATVCFFTNVLQVAVFGRPSAVRCVKGVLLLSQCMSGLVATFVVAFPIHVISSRGGSVGGAEGYAACYLGHSGVILVAGLSSLGTSTLLLLHQYLKSSDPRRFMTAGTNVVGWSVGVCAVWLVSCMVAVAPYAGWNTWRLHDARCHLSTLWPLSFTALLTFIVCGQVAVALLLWAATHAARLRTTGTTMHGVQQPSTDGEEAPIACQTGSLPGGGGCGRVSVTSWCVSVGALVPLLAHVVMASSCAASSPCLAHPGHYHEDAAALPWASLLLCAAGVTNPLLYVFTDDQVSSSTLLLLSRVCCWWCEGKKQRLVPRVQQPHDAETNVYVTNDTDHLVGDST